MKYDLVRDTLPEEIQFGAALFLNEFDPETASVEASAIRAASSGGFSFKDTPEFGDAFEGIDHMPANTKEGKYIKSRSINCSGTFVTITPEVAKSAMAAADIDGDGIKITPRDDLKDEDFEDFWIVADYSYNNGEEGGYMAIHMMNALSQDGFSWQTTDNAKGQFAINYMAHYSTKDIKKVPYEVYIKKAEAA